MTLRQYHDARLADLEFDEECRAYNHIVDLRIGETLRSKALEGDLRALSLYYSRVREIYLFTDASNSGHELPPPYIAEAMLHGGLMAYRKRFPNDPAFNLEPPDEIDLGPPAQSSLPSSIPSRTGLPVSSQSALRGQKPSGQGPKRLETLATGQP